MPTIWDSARAKSISREEFIQNLNDSGLWSRQEIDKTLQELAGPGDAADGAALAKIFVTAGELTGFQAEAIYERRFSELVIGNYEVLDRLGVGAMGTVYKARHRHLKRLAALKVLPRDVGQAPELVRRFRREVEVVARLSHPNIVMAYDADEALAGNFLVMEFVNGQDLATAVVQRGALPIREAVDSVLQAARGLAYAHDQGIVHRDIKPANLLRDITGTIKVADLGLARFSDALKKPGEVVSRLTQVGGVLGTASFMPPEQARDSTTIDHRADIYSLGCTLYYLLTARVPYPGTSVMETLLLHRDAPIPSLCAARTEIPPALDAIFRRMAAKQPADRFQSMTEVVKALESIATTLDEQTAGPRMAPAAGPSGFPIKVETSTTAQSVDRGHRGISLSFLRVVLVEPSRTQSAIIRKYLEAEGVKDIIAVASGQEALEAIRSDRPDAVISTLHLADMTGVELARQIRTKSQGSAPGFVLISSEADMVEAGSLSQCGEVVLLRKPFSPEKVTDALTSVLHGIWRRGGLRQVESGG
jgi:serine/threonine protein kinase